MKRVCILGSTGSIGTQTLEVIAEHPDLFEAYVLTAGRNADLLIRQAKEYQPQCVVIADESKYDYVCEALKDEPIQVYAGADALCQVVQMEPVDIVLTALVGFSGLRPTISAIEAPWPTRRHWWWPASSSHSSAWSTRCPCCPSIASTAPSSKASWAR